MLLIFSWIILSISLFGLNWVSTVLALEFNSFVLSPNSILRSNSFPVIKRSQRKVLSSLLLSRKFSSAATIQVPVLRKTSLLTYRNSFSNLSGHKHRGVNNFIKRSFFATMSPNLRGTANIQIKDVGRNVITVAGWEGCGFYRRSRQTMSTLELLFPDKIALEDVNFPDRDTYKAWLAEEKTKNDFGDKGKKHTSSPFVRLNGSYLGGCDDSLDFARDFCLSSAQGLAPQSDESKSSNTTSSDGVMIDDGFTKEHGFDYDLVVIGGGS